MTRPDFLTWVNATYGNPDRHWIRRNEPALRKAYDSGLQPRPSKPVPERRVYDRYSEL